VPACIYMTGLAHTHAYVQHIDRSLVLWLQNVKLTGSANYNGMDFDPKNANKASKLILPELTLALSTAPRSWLSRGAFRRAASSQIQKLFLCCSAGWKSIPHTGTQPRTRTASKSVLHTWMLCRTNRVTAWGSFTTERSGSSCPFTVNVIDYITPPLHPSFRCGSSHSSTHTGCSTF